MEEERIYGARETYGKILELAMVVHFIEDATFETVILLWVKVRASQNSKIFFGFLFCGDNKRIMDDRYVYVKIKLKVTCICER
jgi:hypothetical protein